MSLIDDFQKLQALTPRFALINTNSENSAYTNYSTFNKNCYMVSGTHYNEDVFYAQYTVYSTSCVDCFDVEKSELCYELLFSEKCYNCSFGAYLIGCNDCDFCFDAFNCQNCLLCTAIQNKRYHILNKPYSKEEYEQKRKFLSRTNSADELWQMLNELRLQTPQRFAFQKNCENCTGSDLRNSKNLIICFGVKNGEDIIYGGTNINRVRDSMDIDNCAATMSEDLYQVVGATAGYSLLCCNCCWFSQDLYYCEMVFNSHDCFGCISRNHAEYEILNVKYPTEEYFKRITEIKQALDAQSLWGKMWLPSTYPYEDTVASIWYPIL